MLKLFVKLHFANAKMALEEAFTPHLKSMLSAKLAEDEIEEDDDVFEGEHDEEEDEEEVEEVKCQAT